MIPTPEDVLVSSKPAFNAQSFPYSYSSLSSYHSCAYGFKLNYLDREIQVGNFFSDFGSLVHLIFEKYLKGDLEIFELSTKFMELYPTAIKINPPPIRNISEEKYIQDAKDCFDNIDFDVYKYEPICIEGKYKIELDGINVVVKPDAILRHNETGRVLLLDYKTAKYTKKKHDEYSVQLSLYKILFEKITGIIIDDVQILYVRENKFRQVKNIDENVLDWVKDTVEKIRVEKDWKPNPDDFNCSYICNVRNQCQFRKDK